MLTHSDQASAEHMLVDVARDLEMLVKQLSEEAGLLIQDVTLITCKTLHNAT